jgi:hypothetical protein
MKRLALMTVVLAGLGLGGARWVAAEAPSKPPAAKTAPPAAGHDHGAKPDEASGGGMSGGMMGGGMMGHGMMGGGMMGGGMCPLMMMGGADTHVAVKNVDKGVTITLTSADAATAARLQKLAEAMRLIHEAHAQ